MRDNELHYSTLLQMANDAIITADKDGRITAFNKTAEKMFGWLTQDVLGREIEMLMPERYRRLHGENLKHVTQTHTSVIAGTVREYEALRKNNDEFPISITMSLINIDGNVTFMAIIRDISERKKAEGEKERLETQLRHMQKMEAIGQLTGGIAHDFNNLLTAIIGNATLLQMHVAQDPKLENYLEHIFSISEKAATLTRGLLAFSRKQLINIKPVDLNAIIITVEKLLLRLIGEDVELKTTLDSKEIIIKADAGQMEQVLMNLATNARDAMPNGGYLSITTAMVNLDDAFVKEHNYGKPGQYALLTVSDTGTGISAATLERIFEPFFTTKEIGKGTGMGLSIVYGIIKQHDGYINVYSEIGKGTAFKIYLPVLESRVEVLEPKQVQAPKGGTETILLAEDETEVRQFIRAILEEFGYSVIEAIDGEDAINKFKADKDNIKLLILDVIMPNKIGSEAYESITTINPNIKTLFTSGYNEDIIHKKGVLKEKLNFISKPFIPTEFLRLIRAILDN